MSCCLYCTPTCVFHLFCLEHRTFDLPPNKSHMDNEAFSYSSTMFSRRIYPNVHFFVAGNGYHLIFTIRCRSGQLYSMLSSNGGLGAYMNMIYSCEELCVLIRFKLNCQTKLRVLPSHTAALVFMSFFSICIKFLYSYLIFGPRSTGEKLAHIAAAIERSFIFVSKIMPYKTAWKKIQAYVLIFKIKD